MEAQKNNYLANNFTVNHGRHGGSRLGDRTLFSHTVDGKRYYSSLDAEIFFGETYIDEVVQINWSVEQATMPLFGYNSYTFDDLAIGARQVSGTFVVNFTKSGFMYDVLRSVQAVSRSTFYTADEAGYKVNWSSHFDKEHSASWDKSFNIRVGYGDYTKKGQHTTMIVIHCVQLTGCQQMLSTDGGVIGEVYSFIAKDIRYEMETLPEKDPVKNESNAGENNVSEKEEQFLFTIESLSIEKENGRWYVKLKNKHNAGKIKGIGITLKRDNMTIINSVQMDLGNGTDIKQMVEFKNSYEIDKCLENQERLGVKPEDLILYSDISVSYELKDKPNNISTITKKKVNVKK